MKFIIENWQIILSVVSGSLLLSLVNYFSSTQLEKVLETNYQKFIRNLINIFGITIIVFSIGFIIWNNLVGKYQPAISYEEKTVKISGYAHNNMREIRFKINDKIYYETLKDKDYHLKFSQSHNNYNSIWSKNILSPGTKYEIIEIHKTKDNSVLSSQIIPRLDVQKKNKKTTDILVWSYFCFIILSFIILLYGIIRSHWNLYYKKKYYVHLSFKDAVQGKFTIIKKLSNNRVLLISNIDEQKIMFVSEATLENKIIIQEQRSELIKRRQLANYELHCNIFKNKWVNIILLCLAGGFGILMTYCCTILVYMLSEKDLLWTIILALSLFLFYAGLVSHFIYDFFKGKKYIEKNRVHEDKNVN
ncbi:hypothetical protein OGZ37_11000 [Lactococcus lactis]|uniref:hypothetical protein n=1 Tax=Lactococcus lactis TaxID=1358 RepID=UPI00241836E5|nr:hypothetical protein [Lactococcus lactis]MDG4967095.1 hypothetical protein [Lactococcus lactis]